MVLFGDENVVWKAIDAKPTLIKMKLNQSSLLSGGHAAVELHLINKNDLNFIDDIT